MRHLSAIIASLMLGGFMLLSAGARALTMTPIPPNTIQVSPTSEDINWQTDQVSAPSHVWYGPGGPTWTTFTGIPGSESIRDISIYDSNRAFLITGTSASTGKVYYGNRQPNGAYAWSSIAATSFLPNAVAAVNFDTVAVAGYSSSLRTFNLSGGGAISPDLGMSTVRDMSFAGGAIWVAGNSTSLARYDVATNSVTSVPTNIISSFPLVTQYTDIAAFDAAHVWAASGTYVSVTMDGSSWSHWNSPGAGAIEDVAAIALDEAYAVARSGYIYRMKGATAGWTAVQPTTLDFLSLGAGGTSRLMAFGCCQSSKDYVSYSTDGVNWTAVQPLSTQGAATSADFLSPTMGMAAGSLGGVSTVLHYAPIYPNVKTSSLSSTSHIINLSTGLQEATNYHASADSYQPAGAIFPLTSAESGDFLFTTAGLSITGTGVKTANLTSTSTDLVWTTSLDADTVAHVSPALTWKVQTNVAVTTFQGIDADGERAVTIGAVGDVIKSSGDLGQTWPATTAISDFGSGVSIQAGHGWGVGNGFIMRTTNGGSSWTNQTAPSAYYLGVFGLDDLHAWAVGDAGTGVIVRTVDGGASWQTVFTPAPTLRGIEAVDGHNVLAVGDSNKIYRSTDGGTTWSEAAVNSPVTSFLRLSMADANTGWAVGTGGIAVQTTDGGKTWNQAFAGCSNQTFYGVSAVSTNEVWIVGSNGTVKRWTSAGGCQNVATGINPATDVRGVAANGTDVWLAGANGTIARYGLDTGSAGYRTFRNATPLSSHAASITGLTPNTLYNYFVQSTDANGFTVVSGLKTFQTPPEATMQLTPTALTFTAQEGAANPAKQQFQVADQFGSNLGQWSMVSNQPWLTATPAAGSSTAATPATVDVNVNISGLTAGNYSGKITVTTNDPSVINRIQDVNVTLTVTLPPKLVLSTNTLTFTAQQGDPLPASQAVSVTNGNVGSSLNYTMSKLGGAPWLNISSAGVSPYPTPNQIVVQPNTTATVGVFTETIRVDGGVGTQNSPQDISVTYTVTPGPVLKLTPGPNPTLNFSATQGGSNPPTQSVVIENGGGGTLAWTATASQAWLTFAPANDGNGPTAMTISPQTGALSPGLKTGTITVNAGAAGTQTITVNFDIAAAPVLSVTPMSLTFTTPQGTNPADQTFQVTGGGALWSASVTAGGAWLSLPGTTSGSTYPTVVPVHAEVVATGLVVGTYAGNIRVTSAAAIPNTIDIPVTLDVTAPPVLSVSPLTLNFTATEGGANPASQAISIANTGAGTLNWTINQPAEAWTRVSTFPCAGPYPPTISGIAPATVNVCIDITGLSSGGYTTTATVEAAGALGAPKTVTINLTVNPDTAGPVMSARVIQTQCAPGNVFAFVKWTTDELSNSTVYYGETVDANGVPQYELPGVMDPALVTDHSIYIENLNGGHRYYVKVQSTDQFGNTTVADRDPSNAALFWSFVASASCDMTPPQNVTLTVPPNPLFGTVNVRVDAEDQSGLDSVELYGSWNPLLPFAQITVPPGSCVAAGAIYQCSVLYSWNTTLVPDGTYDVFARAIDINLNAADSPSVSVTIDNAVPTVRNVKAEPFNVGGEWRAKITWDTDKPSSSRVDYGREDATGGFTYNQSKDGDDNGCTDCLNHQVTLTNLLGGQIYHFQVTSCSVINPSLCGH